MLAMAAEIAVAAYPCGTTSRNRSRRRSTASLDVPLAGDRVVLHHDDGRIGGALVPERDPLAPDEGTHLYVCGPG